ncbi:hypothetical protein ACHAWF_006665 [Thalassiosira exigua]
MGSILIASRRCPTNERSYAVLLRGCRCASSKSTETNAASKASDDAITVDGTLVTKSGLAAQCLQPRPIFPWRSSPDPLERLRRPEKPSADSSDTDEETNARLDEYYESDYFTRGGPLGPGWPSPMESWFRGALYANSMNLLGVSWLSVLMPWTRKDWEHDMELGFQHAFISGVNGMIENTYTLLEQKNDTTLDDDVVESDDEGVSCGALDVTLDPLPLVERNGGVIPPSDTNKGEESGSKSRSNRKREEYSMLQQNLRELYQSARQHSHPSKVNIVLRTEPQSAKIESMFPVFGLSRPLVQDHPNLRHTYRNLIQRFQRKHREAVLSGKKRVNPIETGQFLIANLCEVMERSEKMSDDGHAAVTIIAQVSINCKEIFCVRDVESGKIIQGCDSVQPRDVTHLVRFEMIVREVHDDSEEDSSDGDGWAMELGRWQVTDWDDLLDGNVFFT